MGHGGGGPLPPEIDNLEVMHRTADFVVLAGVTNEGKPVKLMRIGDAEYFLQVGQRFRVTFIPLPADNVPAG